ncbi:hypothetical protein CR513_27652, partial [Mucuna pruriens]
MVSNIHSDNDSVRRKVPIITFMNQNFIGTNLEQNDPMVITVEAANFAVNKVLVNQGSSANIMYMSTFKPHNPRSDLTTSN